MGGHLALRDKYVVKDVYLTHPLTIVRGLNEKLYDEEGREYIDFTSGIGVTNLGHVHPELVEAAVEQLKRLWHIAIAVANYPTYVELAKELAERVRLSGPGRVAFFNSGAEATENAVKITRKATGKPYIVSFVGAFHGRTTLALSLTGKYKPYKVGFEPLAPGVVKALYPYCYRLPVDDEKECVDLAMRQLELLVDVDLDPGVVAAVIVEPVQGEGGFIVPPREFFKELEGFARRRDIALIVDEIQTGYCRTGRFMAYEHFGIQPEVVTLGKAIANGLPLSAVVVEERLVERVEANSIGGTFGGNPVATAVALRVLRIIERDRICERAEYLGRIIEDHLDELSRRFEVIGEHRGLGVMRAVELVKDKRSREPAREETRRVLEEARRRGLLLLSAGYYGNVIRLHPPLTIPEESLLKGLEILKESMRSAL